MTLLARSSKPPTAEERIGHASQDVTALLQRGSTFEGKLAFEGTVHINGTFAGEIHSKDTLVIGEGAKVQGEIDVGTLIINGEFTGQIRARQLVQMHPPARVHGTVLTPALVIDRGVIFEGTTRMESPDAPVVLAPTPKVAKTAG
jgi:cytoskeletal protein CcmA (bactofilin family)